MSFSLQLRCGAALSLLALISGCSSGPASSSRLLNECTWNRSGCMYEGSYEDNEEEYAEEEARRLNKAQMRKLRSGS